MSAGLSFSPISKAAKPARSQKTPMSRCFSPGWLWNARSSFAALRKKVSTAETLAYFITRPRGSQLGAWVSAQSSIITTRSLLEQKWEEMKRKFGEGQVPLPSFWGGYRVVPREIEFWQGRPSRLHDRFLYTRQTDGSWDIDRLAP